MSTAPNEPRTSDLSLATVLHALSDETRLSIVDKLAESDDEVACNYFDVNMPKSSLSHHFRVLIASGVITRRREGTARLNRLRKADLNTRFPGLLDSIIESRKAAKTTVNETLATDSMAKRLP